MDDLKQKLAQDENIIYHYTNAIAALCYILPNFSLRLSPFCNMNDPHEYSYPSIPVYGWGEISYNVRNRTNNIRNEISQYRANHYKFVSFCTSTNESPGYMKPRMWAQYGDNQKGICLAFDKTKLIKKSRAHFHIVYPEMISYHNLEDDLRNLGINFNNTDDSVHFAVNFINKHKSILLFSKPADFKDEKEFRIIAKSSGNDAYIDIRDSIVAIIAGDRFYDGLIPSAFYFAEQYDIDLRRVYWNDGQYELLYLGPKERYGDPIMGPLYDMQKKK